ncbi:hypothetical protein QS257_16060 [Terrilactibacillus sp. S3-3]|nr:hypothetical protein QS257_16060 [Terrilactibacillus sp. S3-3]
MSGGSGKQQMNPLRPKWGDDSTSKWSDFRGFVPEKSSNPIFACCLGFLIIAFFHAALLLPSKKEPE